MVITLDCFLCVFVYSFSYSSRDSVHCSWLQTVYLANGHRSVSWDKTKLPFLSIITYMPVTSVICKYLKISNTLCSTYFWSEWQCLLLWYCGRYCEPGIYPGRTVHLLLVGFLGGWWLSCIVAISFYSYLFVSTWIALCFLPSHISLLGLCRWSYKLLVSYLRLLLVMTWYCLLCPIPLVLVFSFARADGCFCCLTAALGLCCSFGRWWDGSFAIGTNCSSFFSFIAFCCLLR